MRTPRVLTKGGVRYYSDLFRFSKGGRNTNMPLQSEDVRFYVRLDNHSPAEALWAKARLHKLHHGWNSVMREISAQEHRYSTTN
tara:strand:- start:851 stop:1102 length:252 start_codon:yes stop_codon:yes gene_type:complete